MTERSPYIVGPTYDWIFFLWPPLIALGLGIAIADTGFAAKLIVLSGQETTAATVLIGVLIHAHLVAVFFRSHGNPDVFSQHKLRFVLVPIVLWALIVASPWIAVLATVVATFWDVWHSGAQTFGFARIYDRNAGLPPTQGRKLDFWLNQLLYAGPILAGATMMDHVEVFGDFATFDDAASAFLTAVPAEAEGNQRYLTWLVVGGGTAFLVYYVWANVRFARQGRGPSKLKVYLLVSTGLCSIYTWGFNSWGEAFFIMNFFHAVQYLGLVWATESRGLLKRTRLAGRRWGRPALLASFVGLVFAYGCAAELADAGITWFWATTIVVSLMHFWYDAFIWSVRKKQI